MSSLSRFLLCFSWLTTVAVGFGYAWRYEAAAGEPARASNFPSVSRIELAKSEPTIVMFAHPNCPCTVASIDELAAVLQSHPQKARMILVVVQPSGLPESLETSETAKAARQIESAIVLSDPKGVEAKRFGAATSGQVVVFDPTGAELFRGGVTSARGHRGPSSGTDALAAILESKIPMVHSTPVFGCSLLEGFR